MNRKKRSSGMAFYGILLLILIATSYFMTRVDDPNKTNLSDVQRHLAEKKIDEVVINGEKLEVTLKSVEGKPAEKYIKQIHPLMIDDLYQQLRDAYQRGEIKIYDYNKPTDLGSILNIGFSLLLIGAMVFLMWFSFNRQSGDGRSAMNFGRSRARLNEPGKSKVNFSDVAGADEEKEELQEVVDFLKNPNKYSTLGAKIPKGILLVGAPGTGKTLLAKAVSGEAEVPFFSISGSDFVEMFVGVGASRVRDMFDDAKKRAPCIVFIDEIDAVGRQRGAGLGGGHDEREQTLNQLLVEMDGFGPNEGVIVMAATNRPDILDPALLRPGRFDRRITVMRPDLLGREAILQVHAKDKPIDSTVNLKEIAKITPGFTGADLANLLNEAALLAARKNARVITYEDISEAVFKVTIGPEKRSRVISEKERNLTAYHEAGHAIVLRSVSDTDRVERVSIIPAGGAGGYTAFKPNEDIYFQTKQHLIAEIMIALGGRAAEQLTLAEISTGATADLQHCNKIARDMVTKYGMSERLGNFVISGDDEVFLGRDYGHMRAYSEQISAEIDEEVRVLLHDAYNDTLAILEREHVLLEKLAQELLAHEKVEGPEFEEIYKTYVVDFKPAPGGEEVKHIVNLAPEAEDSLPEMTEQDAAEVTEAEPSSEAADVMRQLEHEADAVPEAEPRNQDE